MKKYFIICMILLLLTGCKKTTSVSMSKHILDINQEAIDTINKIDKEAIGTYDVNLYLFYLSGCPHCHNEITWLDSIKDDYKYLHIYKYETSENMDLYNQVVSKMNINSNYVPLTIIGEKYKVGFNDSTKESIIELIEEYSKYDYNDKAKDIIDKNQ